jgi:hypothetical protein
MAAAAASASAAASEEGAASPLEPLPLPLPDLLAAEHDGAAMLHVEEGAGAGAGLRACSDRVRTVMTVLAVVLAAVAFGTLVGNYAASGFAQVAGLVGSLTAAGSGGGG